MPIDFRKMSSHRLPAVPCAAGIFYFPSYLFIDLIRL
jgi:hypothetical protein